MMGALWCWLRGHVWRECLFADWTLGVRDDDGTLLDRCLGACERCGKHRGAIACIVCERVAR